MYYREKLMFGVWYYKTTPDGKWQVKTVQEQQK